MPSTELQLPPVPRRTRRIMAPTFVDLFCGIGGFRIGLEAAGFECVYANDINNDAVEVYKKNRHPDASYPVECADIREVFEERLDSIPPHHFGEECPKYGDLGGYVIKVAAAKRPVAVLLENVPNFFQIGRPWYRNMVAAFEQAGYVCCYNILSAWDFGLPQHRRRGFVVAVRKDVTGVPFKFPPTPQGSQVTLRSSLLAADSAEMGDCEKLRPDEIHMEWRRSQVSEPRWDDLVDKVPEGWRNRTGLLFIGTIKDLGRQANGRLYHDLGVHPCVVGQSISQWILTPGTDDEGPVIRRVHPHEVRRMQGFPDCFELHHLKGITNKQLANAVPPPMVEWIGRAVAEQYREAFIDEDDRNAAQTSKGQKSSRKSSQKPSRKHTRKHSRKHGHKKSGKSSRKSTYRSKTSQATATRSSHSHVGTDSPSRRSNDKRRVSSDSEEAPPPKRQHRKSVTSRDSSPRWSTGSAGFDGSVKTSTRRRHRNRES